MDNKKDPKVEKALPAHTKRVKDDWDKKRNGGDIAVASDPVTNTAVIFTRVEVEGNKVSIWTGDYKEDSPEYVIVNPPTAYPVGDSLVEDPMTALAISIVGAKK